MHWRLFWGVPKKVGARFRRSERRIIFPVKKKRGVLFFREKWFGSERADERAVSLTTLKALSQLLKNGMRYYGLVGL